MMTEQNEEAKEQELLLHIASAVSELLRLEGSRGASVMRDKIRELQAVVADRGGFVVSGREQ